MSSVLLEPVFPALSQHVTGDNLRDFWKLFTKVKDSMQGGRRLENLCWRLWYRYSSPECSLTEQEKICSFFEKIEWRNTPTIDDLKKSKRNDTLTMTPPAIITNAIPTSTTTATILPSITSTASNIYEEKPAAMTALNPSVPVNVPQPSQQPPPSQQQQQQPVYNFSRTTSTAKMTTSSSSSSTLLSKNSQPASKVTGFFVPSNPTQMPTASFNTSNTATTNSIVTPAMPPTTTFTKPNTLTAFGQSQQTKTTAQTNLASKKKKSKFFIVSSSSSDEEEEDYSDNEQPISNFRQPVLTKVPSKSQISSIQQHQQQSQHSQELSTRRTSNNESILFGKINPVPNQVTPQKSNLSTQLKTQKTSFNPFVSRIWGQHSHRFEEVTRADIFEGSESLRLGLQLERQPLHHHHHLHDMGFDPDNQSVKDDIVAW